MTKEAIDEMLNSPGEVRGKVIRADESFILEKGGEEKLEQVQKELEDMSSPFSYREVKNEKFYPCGKKVLSLLAISRVFNMDKRKVKEMGEFSFVRPPLFYLFVKLFGVKSVLKKILKKWRRNYTIGRLEIEGINERKREVIFRLYNFNLHPVFCDYMCGYLEGVGKAMGKNEASCRETECYFKGESFFHQFVLKW